MTVFGCGDYANVGLFQRYLSAYINHGAAAKINGKSAVTTFSGSDCSFGQGSTNAGWAAVFGGYAGQIYFMPAYNSAPTGLSAYNIQAEVNWGSAFPVGSSDIETSRDQWFMKQLGGKGYVGTLAQLFYSHMSYKVDGPSEPADLRTICGVGITGSSPTDGNSSFPCDPRSTRWRSW